GGAEAPLHRAQSRLPPPSAARPAGRDQDRVPQARSEACHRAARGVRLPAPERHRRNVAGRAAAGRGAVSPSPAAGPGRPWRLYFDCPAPMTSLLLAPAVRFRPEENPFQTVVADITTRCNI